MKRHRVDAVLFDFDGTLTLPGALDFDEIRSALGIEKKKPILEYIRSLKDPEAEQKAKKTLHTFEMEAATRSAPQIGAEQTILNLKAKGVKLGILTRNTHAALTRAFSNFKDIGPKDFDIVITRDDEGAHKPEPDGIHKACLVLGTAADRMAIVGDYLHDVQAGKRAGILTILLSGEEPRWMAEEPPDYHVRDYSEFWDLITQFLPLSAGKLPAPLFKNLMSFIITGSGRPPANLTVGPGIGEDAAVIDINSEELLVIKTDPVTFTADRAGYYAVIVNGNDIVCTGGKPQYFAASMLFPKGATLIEIRSIIAELIQCLKRQGAVLVGGHTEVTDAVTRTVISGTMIGFVGTSGLLRKENMREGDKILLTRHPGVEGTTLLAKSCGNFLLEHGLLKEELKAAEDYEKYLSIRREADIALGAGVVRAFHDITEGGLATAIRELAAAGGRDLELFMDKIPLSLLTEKICKICGIDSLGLIGSGSLLICASQETAPAVLEALHKAGIKAAEIGKVLGEGGEVHAKRHTMPAVLPSFDVDELARFYSNRET